MSPCSKSVGILLQIWSQCSRLILAAEDMSGPDNIVSISMLFPKGPAQLAAQGPQPGDAGPGSLASSLLCSAFLSHASGEKEQEGGKDVSSPPISSPQGWCLGYLEVGGYGSCHTLTF